MFQYPLHEANKKYNTHLSQARGKKKQNINISNASIYLYIYFLK